MGNENCIKIKGIHSDWKLNISTGKGNTTRKFMKDLLRIKGKFG